MSSKKVSNLLDDVLDKKIESILKSKAEDFHKKSMKCLEEALEKALSEIYGGAFEKNVNSKIKEAVKNIFDENKSSAQVVFESCAERLIRSNSFYEEEKVISYSMMKDLEKRLDKLYMIVLKDELNSAKSEGT